MGGAVSSGESNDELVDNLLEAEYIKSGQIERVFRAVDRAMYYTESHKSEAYKDLAWKEGNLHLSAPCIYSEVMENIQLEKGMSFLNLGSGTGYLSTMCGLMIGRNGVNHGVELFPEVVEYAREKLGEFFRVSPALDVFDFCPPEFVVGNCLEVISTKNRYDRIYCGAACPEESIASVTQLLKVGGICIMPVNDSLIQIIRVSETKDTRKSLLPVSFAALIVSRSGAAKAPITLPEWTPTGLQDLCRSGIRSVLRDGFTSTSIKGSDEVRKKRSTRGLDRRRANRLLVVERRSRVEDGQTGFVAVAYSLGQHSHSSSMEEESYSDREMHDVSEPDFDSDDDDVPDLADSEGNIVGRSNQNIPMDTTENSAACTSTASASGTEMPSDNGHPQALKDASSDSHNNGTNGTNGGGESSNGNGRDRGSFLRHLKEFYRGTEERNRFRQLLTSATNSMLVRASNSEPPIGNGSLSTVDTPSTSGNDAVSVNGSGTGTGAKRDQESHSDFCDWSTTTDSSSDSNPSSPTSTSSASTEEDEEMTGKTANPTGDKNHATAANRMMSRSVESGVVPDAPPEAQDEVDSSDEDDDSQGIRGGYEAIRNKMLRFPREDEKVPEDPLLKLRKDPVSSEMRNKIRELPLPPAIKLYLNYYRPLQFDD